MQQRYRILKPIVMALVGVSGSGKSTLEQNMIRDYPDLFYKLQQFSTRNMRPGETFGNPYIFVQRDTFDVFKEKLIGVIGCSENSHFKDKYGSLPDFKPGYIPTIIVAEEGVLDLKRKCKDVTKSCSEYDPFVIGLDVRYEELSEEDRAARGRDDDFVAKERAVLQHADIIYKNGNGAYVNPREIVSSLLARGVIEKVTVQQAVTA
jgi:hypothetical protein